MASEGEIVRLNLIYSLPNASQAMNVFHWLITDSCPDSEVRAEMVSFADEWATDWAPIADDVVTLVEGEVIILSEAGAVLRNLAPVTIDVSGDLTTAQTLPAAVSGLLQAASTVAGHYGRKYVPGIATGLITQGLFNSTAMTQLAGLLLEWLTTLETASAVELRPGFYSEVLSTFVRFLTPGTITDVPAYQRRRKPNVGS
jgi:hypothetical protein